MSIILTILASILSLQPAVESPQVKGARISPVPKPQAILNLTIENRRASHLIEWQIALGRRPGEGIMGHTGFGSIQPGERRTIPIRLSGAQDAAEGTLIFVAFEDGYYEGIARAVQEWRSVREERAKDLSYWVRVFGMMPRVSEPELRRYLAEHSVKRAGEVPRDPSGVSAKLQAVLQRYPAGPDVWDALDRLRIETQAALARATREPSNGTGGGGVDAVSSAVITAQTHVGTTSFMVAIENLGRKAIEAMGFEILDPATKRPRGGQTADFCGTDRLIQPKEIREFFPGTDVNPDTPPVVRMTFVLYDDLSFEGSTEARDELLRRREIQADEYAHAIATVKHAAALPPEQVEGFLRTRRAERAKQLMSEGRRGETHVLEQLLREARATPGHFLAGASARAESLERAHQRLLRHKVPPAK